MLRLSGIVLLISFLWLIVLPWFGRFAPVRAMIDRNQSAGIDVGAVFYTEHPSSRDWDREVQQKVLEEPRVFWSWPTP